MENQSSALIADLNQKCLNLKQNIDKIINEIYKGEHNTNIDKIKEKTLEKYENFGESLRLLETLILEKISGDSQKVWKK